MTPPPRPSLDPLPPLAEPAAARGPRHSSPRAGRRRRLAAVVDLVLATVVCLVGFEVGADRLRVWEAAWVARVLRLAGVDSVSGALPGHLLVFRADGEVLNGEVTASCSSILPVVGLVALTVAVLRGRRQHAVAGLAAAVAAVLVANHVRLAASTLAGVWWGQSAMVLFHDWVGTLWNFGSTLIGFLVMVCVSLPAAERAEQDVAGRHTARRPTGWARPGLGYRLPELDSRAGSRRRTLTSLVHRYLLPRRVSRALAARREAARIDYRIGHLPPAERVRKVQELVADGLGAHTASLVAVATYDDDRAVLDVLAREVAARQWEPVTSPRVAALRLWARGWLQATATAVPAASPGDDVTAPTAAHPRSFAVAPPPPPARPRSFARDTVRGGSAEDDATAPLPRLTAGPAALEDPR